MKLSRILPIVLGLVALSIPACHNHAEHTEEVHQKIVVTNPKKKDINIAQQYVCQIHSQRHIKVKALQMGYLEPIPIKEGQLVQKDQVLFTINPTLYKAKWDAELAEAQLALQERINTKALVDKKIVTERELVLYDAKLARAEAKAKLAEREYNFTMVKAPFDGIVDRLYEMQGSLVKEGDALTTLSDNSVMWVYFNVPEKQYYEYMALSEKEKQAQRIELMLANHSIFQFTGKLGKDPTTGKQYGAIEAKFNNETGTVPFRADFPNPDRLLRHGMTGNVLVHRTLKDVIVIPQRATFEILAKRYVYVVGNDDVVHPREINVEHVQEDIFVVNGIDETDKIVYEGIRQVRDNDKVAFEYRAPDQILGHQENHAE